MSTVTPEQRHTRRSPCLVCGGYDGMVRGKGGRCYGFQSADRLWEHCTREEYAGGLPQTDADTYAHRLGSDCNCGSQHPGSAGTRRNGHSDPEGRLVPKAEYVYADAVPPVKVVCYSTGGPKKTFRQFHQDGNGGWRPGRGGAPRILYRRPELRAADPELPVFVVEGEKDVETIWGLHLVATTNPEGAGKWRDEFAEELRGRRVVVLHDNDKPGRKHALRVLHSVYGKAAWVKWVELPGIEVLGDGADVTDWVGSGHTREELLDRVETTPTWEPQGDSDLRSSAQPDPRTQRQRLKPWEFHRTDTGNAALLAQEHADRIRWDCTRGRWLAWNEHLWRPNWDGQVMRLAQGTVRRRLEMSARIEDKKVREAEAGWALQSENKHRLAAMIDLAKSQRAIEDDAEWDTSPMLLGVANGVLDLRTGVLRAGQPSDRITKQTHLRYDADEVSPRWKKFLDDVFEGDTQLIEAVQMYAGYSLTGDTSEDVWFLCYGTGANGKSTLLNVLRKVAGSYGENMPFFTLEVNSRLHTATDDLARLYGARLVTSSETREGTRLNEARIKALAGGDPITARALYGKYFSYEPQFKLWLAVNHLPVVQDYSEGFWRRVRIIPFNRRFSGAEQIPHLGEELLEEGPGILSWMVDGCLKWLEDGRLPTPEKVQNSTAAYQRDQDPVRCFVDECCEKRDDAMVSSAILAEAFESWAQDRGYPKNLALGKRLTALGFRSDRVRIDGKQVRVRRGITLREG